MYWVSEDIAALILLPIIFMNWKTKFSLKRYSVVNICNLHIMICNYYQFHVTLGSSDVNLSVVNKFFMDYHKNNENLISKLLILFIDWFVY